VGEDRVPVPFRRLRSGTILVDVAAAGEQRVVVYARVSSRDQRWDLDRQVSRLTEWATPAGWEVGQVVAEVGSGSNGKRAKLSGILSDPCASVIVVEYRDRLACFGVEHLRSALAAQGRRIVVVEDGERTDDLVRDMIEVLTRMCAGLYGRRGARNRAMRAVTATNAGSWW
jgi:putative resolvase